MRSYLAGIGGAGIFSGCFIIIAECTPLRKRSFYTAFLGTSFGIASVVGPLLGEFSISERLSIPAQTSDSFVGGAFTTRVSWRWCFYSKSAIVLFDRRTMGTDTNCSQLADRRHRACSHTDFPP